MSVTTKWSIPKTPLFNPQAAQQLLNLNASRFLDSALNVMQANIVLEAPVGATGDLRAKVMVVKVSALKGEVISPAKYSSSIEYGRRAAPVAPSADASLSAWIRRSRAGQSWYSSLKTKYPKITIEGAIYILKRSKKQKPTPPNNFFTRGIDKSRPTVANLAKNLGLQLGEGL